MPAMGALAFSVSGHGLLQDRNAHVAPAGGRRPKKIQMKKTQKQQKKSCYSDEGEEYPFEDDPIFKPPVFLHFRNAAEKPPG